MMTWRTVLLAMALCAGWGCDRQLVGVAKPQGLLDFGTQPEHEWARITAVQTSGTRTYLGFSDGEMFFQPDVGAAWASYGQGPYGGCGQPVPGGPVTAFAVTEATTFVAYAGTPGSHGVWRSPDDHPCWAQAMITDDFLSLSVSPFSDIELIALGEGLRWVSADLGGGWAVEPGPPSLNFDGDARALASGVGPTGAPRAWLGDGEGHLYYSDDLGVASSPDQIGWQPVAPDPGFPNRPVVAISIAAERPATIWVTFLGMAPDSLWTSDDGGVSWRNPHGGDLPFAPLPSRADGGPSAPFATFAKVSLVPGTGVALVTALVPDATNTLTATSFWNNDGSNEWWPL